MISRFEGLEVGAPVVDLGHPASLARKCLLIVLNLANVLLFAAKSSRIPTELLHQCIDASTEATLKSNTRAAALFRKPDTLSP